MTRRKRNRNPRPSRTWTPGLERLDIRALLSASGLGARLGAFVAPGAVPRFSERRTRLLPPLTVNPQNAINRLLQGDLGPGLDRIERQAQRANPTTSSSLSRQIYAQPFIQAVLSDNDTYQLLNAPPISLLLTPQALTANTQGNVSLTLPASDLIALGNPTLILVKPGDPGPNGGVFASGFQVEVDPASVVVNPNNTITVQVPASQIPSGVQLVSSSPISLNAIYNATGPLLTVALSSGQTQGAPTAVPTVPGLRLVDALPRNHNFPSHGTAAFTRILRLMAAGNVLANLNPNQQALVTQGVNAFLATISNWSGNAALQASRAVPSLPRGPLSQTLAVTVGTVQPNGPNLPQRIDVGFIIARDGDFGLILAAQGPLTTTLPAPGPNNVVAGDVRVAVSNAPNLAALNGWQTVEGVTEGAVLSGALSATNQGGVATFAAAAGYGAGFAYGLGTQYATVIPLGNIFSTSV
jgi:hypothetical protein